jgi:hypothetical protein
MDHEAILGPQTTLACVHLKGRKVAGTYGIVLMKLETMKMAFCSIRIPDVRVRANPNPYNLHPDIATDNSQHSNSGDGAPVDFATEENRAQHGPFQWTYVILLTNFMDSLSYQGPVTATGGRTSV